MNVVPCGHCGGLVDRTMHQSDVVEFMRKFEIDYNGPPRVLPPELLEFRQKLESEEHQEFMDATTLEEQVDALIDKLYVTYGTLHLMGVPINKCWERVHRCNMAKELADDPSKTKRGHAHDLTKPPGWQPPYYKDIIPDVQLKQPEPTLPSVPEDAVICGECRGFGRANINCENETACTTCNGLGYTKPQPQASQPNATPEINNP